MIEYAEIMLYDENDDSVGFSLSPMQLKVVCKILGITPGEDPGTISCYSDKMLERFFELHGNPLTAEIVKGD